MSSSGRVVKDRARAPSLAPPSFVFLRHVRPSRCSLLASLSPSLSSPALSFHLWPSFNVMNG